MVAANGKVHLVSKVKARGFANTEVNRAAKNARNAEARLSSAKKALRYAQDNLNSRKGAYEKAKYLYKVGR